MDNILEIAARNQERAWEIIKDTDIINIWQSAGAKINLVGSVKTGLLMKHLDIDFHIYSNPLVVSESFGAMSRLAENTSIKRIEYSNLIDTKEHCIEWHAWFEDKDSQLWQIDMIHIAEGTFYDGYIEKVTDRIGELLTPETKKTILKLKYDTPDTEKIIGIEYYQAVLRDGVNSYEELLEWRKQNPIKGVVEWIP